MTTGRMKQALTVRHCCVDCLRLVEEPPGRSDDGAGEQDAQTAEMTMVSFLADHLCRPPLLPEAVSAMTVLMETLKDA